MRETELKRFLDLYSVRYHMQLGFKFFIIFCSLILCQATILSPLCRGVSDAGRPVWLREILPVRCHLAYSSCPQPVQVLGFEKLEMHFFQGV